MESNENNTLRKRCYKAQQPIYGNLQIAHNSSNSNTVLWNKYQIFIYENLKFELPVKVFIPEYQVHDLLITDNYLLCLDTNGFLHLIPLKLKNPAQKLIKCIHQPKDQGIKACITFSQDLSLSLKYNEKYHIIVNKINSDYNEVKSVALNSDEWGLEATTKERCLLAQKKLEQTLASSLQKLFTIENLGSNCHFIVISFDKISVYGCLFDPKMAEDQMKLVKLYSCPSEICSIHIIGTDLLIALSMGSVILLKLDDMINTKEPKPQVTHMNSAIHKFSILEDINTFVYTDGLKMWKVENIFSEQISFSQFYINQVNDFTQLDDTFICTTFSKLIYTGTIRGEKVWLRNEEEYSAAEVLLNNSQCMNQIFIEVERGKALANHLKVEGAYLAAMSLSRRPDIMEQVVLPEINIYNTFDEIMEINDEDLAWTDEIQAYFEPDAYHIHVAVKINSKIQARLYEIITNILENSQAELHVTISNERKTKTTSFKVGKLSCVIPVQLEDSSELNVTIRLVPIVPGTYNRKQLIWIDLYRKDIKLTSEHFVKGNTKRLNLKRPRPDLQTSILNMAIAHYGQQFRFTDTNKEGDSYTMYLRLPRTNIADNFANYLSYTKSVFMLKALSSEEFLTSKSPINFNVGKENVEILLENDGFTNPQLKITSKNLKVTIRIRDFFSNIVYEENLCKAGEEFISNSFYTTVENLQTAVKDCMSTGDFKRFKPLMEEFDKNIMAALPL